MIKKINIFLVLLLLVLCIGAVSAADDANDDVIGSDESITDIVTSDADECLSVNLVEEELLASNTYVINSSNYANYFNSKGNLISTSVNAGDTLEIDGTFSNKNFTFNMRINIVGTSTNNIKNGVFTFNNKASGSTVSNLKIANTNDYYYGIFLDGASNCVIQGCIINNTGQSSYGICVANDANYNNVTDNVINTYGKTYGHLTRSTPPMLLCNVTGNYIANNYITCDDANGIYLSSFQGGPLVGGESTFNTIYNNTIKYNVLPTSWAYGIQVMGGYNTISSNTIIGAYRGISTSNHGNIIVDNWLVNLTGADYNNPGVPSGAEMAIVGSYDSIVKNNHIVNSRIMSSAAGISVLDNSIVENNNVEVLLQGVGIHPQGNNIKIINNTIITNSGSGILYDTYSYNLEILNNTISSNTGIGVLIKKLSDSKMPGNITIVGNNISTSNRYAIDAAEANANSTNVIGPNIIKKGCEVKTPEGVYDPSKPSYVFNGTVYNITPSNVDDFIDANGKLSSDIKKGDILNFTGEFYNRIIYINSAIKITGDNPVFYNTTFRLGEGAWIENVVIRNTKAERLNAWGVVAYKIHGATITNCDIYVDDPNAAYAVYVVEASDIDVINNKLSSSGEYLTYTLLAYAVEDCKFINNTIYTLGTGVVHVFENQHCLDGDTNCLDGDTNCLDGDTNCLDGDTNCLDGDTNCLDGDTNCLDGDTNCLDGDTNCLDGDSNCLDGSSIGSGNHVLTEVYRTYGILMAYSSGNTVSGNKVNVTSKLNETVSQYNSTNSIVGIDLYFNSHDNNFTDNEVYIKANDNYIYGMGVLGYTTGHDAPEGQGALNNRFINNYIVIDGSYCVEGIIIGHESHDTIIKDNVIKLNSDKVSYGITLEMSQKSTISNNYLELNSDVIYGIEAFSSNNNAINNNEFKLNGKQVYGILFSNSNNNSVISNNILANGTGENMDFNNFDSISAGNTGIFLRSVSKDNVIISNTITSHKGYAILVDDRASDNVITDNCLDSEKGIGNGAVSNTQDNIVENNYRYTFGGRFTTFQANYLETAKMTVNGIDDGVLVRYYLKSGSNDYYEIGSAISSNGAATLNYKLDDSLTPGNYRVKAVLTKENYKTKEFSNVLFVLKKGSLNVALNDVSAKKLTYGTFVATVSDVSGRPLSGINVKFYRIHGNATTGTYFGAATTGSNGIAKLVAEIPSVDGNEFVIYAQVDSNANFNQAKGYATLTLNDKGGINITLNDVFADPSDSVTVAASVKDNSGNAVSGLDVNFYMLENGESVLIGSATTGSDGVARLDYTVPSMFDGSYFISAKFDGNANFNPAVDQAILKSNKNALNLVLNNVSSHVSENTTFTAIMKDSLGHVISGLNVEFYMLENGESVIIGSATTGSDGVARLNYAIPSMSVGDHVIFASFAENDNYYSVNGQATLNIAKYDSNFDLDDVSVVYKGGDELVATLTNAVTGKPICDVNVVISINGVDYTVKTNSNGKAMLSTDGLVPGNYVVAIYYEGNNIYNPSNATANVLVSKAPVSISANDVSVIYNGSGELVATLTNAITGKAISGANLVVMLNNVKYVLKTNSKGQISVSISGLTPKIYPATISYAGNSKYVPTSSTVNVIVSKANTCISAVDINVVYRDESEALVATLTNVYGTALKGVNVVVNLDGVDYILKTNSKGQVKVPTNDLSIKTHVATISYAGNSKYNPTTTTVNVVVKANTVISADDVDVVYKDGSGELVATLTNSATGRAIGAVTLFVNLNGENYKIKTDSKGQIKLSTSGLNPKTYVATISFAGTNKYNPSNTTVNVIVGKADSCIDAPDVSVVYKDESGEFTATLTNVYGTVLKGANVVVNLNGVDYALKTDSKGQVKVSTSGLAPGSYVVTISYAGNSKYKPFTTNANIVVDKAPTNISISDVTIGNDLVATLTNVYGTVLKGANVVVNLNGVNYALKTDSKGQVKVSTSGLAPGSYVATIHYSGNSKYLGTNATAKVLS